MNSNHLQLSVFSWLLTVIFAFVFQSHRYIPSDCEQFDEVFARTTRKLSANDCLMHYSGRALVAHNQSKLLAVLACLLPRFLCSIDEWRNLTMNDFCAKFYFYFTQAHHRVNLSIASSLTSIKKSENDLFFLHSEAL